MQFSLDLLRACDQDGRIAGSPGTLLDLNRLARHTTDDFNHFANTETATAAQVVDQLLWVPSGA